MLVRHRAGKTNVHEIAHHLAARRKPNGLESITRTSKLRNFRNFAFSILTSAQLFMIAVSELNTLGAKRDGMETAQGEIGEREQSLASSSARLPEIRVAVAECDARIVVIRGYLMDGKYCSRPFVACTDFRLMHGRARCRE